MTSEGWMRDEDDSIRPTREPEALGAVLRGIAGRRRWQRRLEGAAVFRRWTELVGATIAERCEPVGVRGSTLVIRAESSAWATQIGYLTAEIVARAQDVLGPGVIEEVEVVVGPVGMDDRDKTDAGG